MSLPDRFRSARRLAGLAALILAIVPAGCTVEPLYGRGAGLGAAGSARLASIDIKPVTTRVGQQVRNQLIFMLNGGAGQTGAAEYSMELTVISLTRSSAVRQVTTRDQEPTAGDVVVTGNYTITKVADGSEVARGSRAVTAAFDRPRQLYATSRAERDAQDRAARELAEVLRLAVATDLRKAGG